MDGNLKIIFGLVGGLSLFLFGMNSMSDALQKAAGEKMKKILGFLTKNPVMGALAGALVTAVLQSSSATTVMVIGFVSAGLMSLPQAISVIFGANIGTTMTAQLMAFKITDYIYPIIFIGFMLNFVSKKERVKNIGMVIFSFGLLFEGIEIMGSVMKPLASSPVFIELMSKVKDLPVLGVILGMIMTIVVQSSSATIAVLQNFASQAGPDGVTSVIGLAGAIPILLGDNIGTTITALLASIGQSKNAKRTAVAHSVFNITGSIVFLFIIPVLTGFVQFISPKGAEIDVISRQIANAHTTFNVVCTFIWLPLIPVMVKIVTFIISGDDRTALREYEPQYIDNNLISQPAAAMCLVSKELGRLADCAMDMMDNLKNYVVDKNSASRTREYADKVKVVKTLQDNIASYITKMLSSGNLTENQAEQVSGLLYVSNNIGRIADRCGEIEGICNKMVDDKTAFSKDANEDLEDCISMAQELYYDAVTSVRLGNTELAAKVSKEKNKIRKAEKQFNKAHLNRVKKKQCAENLTADYSGILYSIDRLADNCVAIAEETLDNISFVKFENDEEAAAAIEASGGEQA